jgi:hypothetical protein
MLSLKSFSGKARIAAATGATLLAAGVASVPAAYAGTTSGATPSSVQTVAASCTGHTRAHADHNHVALTFWYNPDGCVGTVKVTVYEAAANRCVHNVQIRVYGNGHRDRKIIRHVPSQFQCGGTLTHYEGIHSRFANPVQVCARAAVNTGGELGPACVTVNN